MLKQMIRFVTLETLTDSTELRPGAAQVRPKIESDEVFHIQERRKKAI
jgi:hypothetical protein